MTPELSAYLGRLVHPARKAYATAYAEHIVNGAAAPKVPLTLDRETARKIQGKVTRYAKRSPAAPTLPSPDGPTINDMAATLQAYAAQRDDSELLGLLEAFVPSTPAEVQAGGCLEKLSDYYSHEPIPAVIDTAECDILDITDLEPSLARALALKLVRWNKGGKVYERRNGRRYINRRIKTIDLNDATVQALPNYSDLVAVCQERGMHHA
jgi:hypothetical protein